MEAASFPGENCLLSKPDCMDVDECDMISVQLGRLESGYPVILSCWKVTAEEIEAMKRTGRVWLMVLGTQMPPVMLIGGDKPDIKD